ncbi:AraC family transcriptional regulator [Corticibacter populi]|uniref:AraC family transcriptional regulator n=1 Tax=Corticibacter populi TaxID=1550736 RepID=A0A3M6QPI6_9BURK|nr:AraC family transcriptional regulator [Corticibacter populi]RMX04312.1 AraC family transcriptional regulator [Corticibacter populi]RZS33079.1 AraC-like DNA-binding protein [Corticibacter populi]
MIQSSRPQPCGRGPAEPVRATPVAFIEAIVQAYARRGMQAAAALAEAQITPAELADGEGCVTARQMERLSALAMRELDDEALGWFGQPLRWGSYGMLLRASISAPDLRVALARWCRHHGLLTRDVRLQLQQQGGVASIAIDEAALAPQAPWRAFCLVSLLRNVHGISCWLLDSQLPLRSIELPFAAPPYAQQLQGMFPGPIRYGAPRAAMRFEAAYLGMPVRRSDAALSQMLQRALLVMIKPYRRDRLMQQRVRQLLQQSDAAAAQTAQALAQQLHVSVRSLHRFLQEDGTSLQAIKDEVRSERARQLLVRTRHPVKKIAGMVGFDNAKSFTRAFTRWTGLSPLQFRQRHAQA